MLDTLVKIPGPEFLFIYFVLFIVCIIGAKIVIYFRDESRKLVIPSFLEPDTIEIALLKRGKAGVVELLSFNLLNKNLIEVTNKEVKAKKLSLDEKPENEAEKLIHEYSATGISSINLVNNKELQQKMDNILSPMYKKLENLHLIETTQDITNKWNVYWFFFAILLIIGGSKFFMGITRGKPSMFLFIELIAFSAILLFTIKPWRIKTTNLGKKYFKSLKDKYSNMKDSLKTGVPTADLNTSLLFAVFGLDAINGVAMYAPFAQNFKSTYTSSACGGGSCSSSGCGGGTSGCSGGGSDGGGGGCGGCGGGGD